jgi:hypothetical protein
LALQTVLQIVRSLAMTHEDDPMLEGGRHGVLGLATGGACLL